MQLQYEENICTCLGMGVEWWGQWLPCYIYVPRHKIMHTYYMESTSIIFAIRCLRSARESLLPPHTFAGPITTLSFLFLTLVYYGIYALRAEFSMDLDAASHHELWKMPNQMHPTQPNI